MQVVIAVYLSYVFKRFVSETHLRPFVRRFNESRRLFRCHARWMQPHHLFLFNRHGLHAPPLISWVTVSQTERTTCYANGSSEGVHFVSFPSPRR